MNLHMPAYSCGKSTIIERMERILHPSWRKDCTHKKWILITLLSKLFIQSSLDTSSFLYFEYTKSFLITTKKVLGIKRHNLRQIWGGS